MFDNAQLKKCSACNMASARIKFCQNWGELQWPAEKYPSIIKQTRSFSAAAVRHVVAGMPKRNPDEIARIMKICQQCLSYVHADERCRKCGCRMPKKILWAEQNCPLSKW